MPACTVPEKYPAVSGASHQASPVPKLAVANPPPPGATPFFGSKPPPGPKSCTEHEGLEKFGELMERGESNVCFLAYSAPGVIESITACLRSDPLSRPPSVAFELVWWSQPYVFCNSPATPPESLATFPLPPNLPSAPDPVIAAPPWRNAVMEVLIAAPPVTKSTVGILRLVKRPRGASSGQELALRPFLSGVPAP